MQNTKIITGSATAPYSWKNNGVSRRSVKKEYISVDVKKQSNMRTFNVVFTAILITLVVVCTIFGVNITDKKNKTEEYNAKNAQIIDDCATLQMEIDHAKEIGVICARAENELYMVRTNKSAAVSLQLGTSGVTANK